MPTAETILKHKFAGTDATSVVTIRPEATVMDAVRLMNERHIGAVVVVDAAGHVVGIFTERDLLKRVVGAERDPKSTRVNDTMTRDVMVCAPETALDDIRQTMRKRRIRHLPVVSSAGDLLGMISIGDLNIAEVKVMAETITYLERYMTST